MKTTLATVSRVPVLTLLSTALIMMATNCYASGSGMPWEGPLEQIVESMTGPVAKGIAVIAILTAGLGMALGESGGGVRKLFGIVFGLTLAFGSVTVVIPMLGFTGGAAF